MTDASTSGQLRTPPSGDYIVGDEAAADASPGDVILVWVPDQERWESRKLPSGGVVPSLAEVLAVGNNANQVEIVNLPDPSAEQDAATPPRRVFVNDFGATIAAGDFTQLTVPLSGHAPGDIAGCYMTSTSSVGWPAIVMSVRTSFFGSVVVRFTNTGPDEAVIEPGALTFYVQSQPSVAI